MYTNKGFSSYNGLLLTLQKNLTHGLQFDFNYTWSHSIDNVSLYRQSDCLRRLRLHLRCRPATRMPRQLRLRRHQLPSAATSPIRYHSAVVASSPAAFPGGAMSWSEAGTSAVFLTWHTGAAYSTGLECLRRGLCQRCSRESSSVRRAPCGTTSTTIASGAMQLYADPGAAASAFTGPVGLQDRQPQYPAWAELFQPGRRSGQELYAGSLETCPPPVPCRRLQRAQSSRTSTRSVTSTTPATWTSPSPATSAS